MTDLLQVPAGEQEVLRVFALDLPPEQAREMAERPANGGVNGGGDPLAAALGVDRLDRARVEIFPAGDLAGVGLSGYLAEGLGVAPGELEGARAALDAETGHLVIVPSQAFGGRAATLDPKPPLRPLGAFRLEQPAPPAAPDPAPRDPAPVPPPDAGAAPRTPPRRLPRLLLLVALLVAAVVVLGLAYLVGGRA
jgi:hypothetical protein